jgi:anaerobic magnesium-protoporphyrin IX monomethyl ester cyclase
MRILVVNPPAFNKTDYIREGRCMQTKSSWAALWMPLSLCYISAVLRKNNHNVRLIDCIAEKAGIDKLVGYAEIFKPELVFINTAIPSIYGDMISAYELKKRFPEILIAVVGMFPTLYEKEVLEKFPQVDFAIMDEPEWVSERLVAAVAENRSPDSVKGLIYRKGSEIIINPRQNLFENNLDELPFPARDLLDNNAYKLPTSGDNFTLLSVGRGCSEACIYCVANLYYGKRFRKRSVASVIKEIEECIEKYNIRNFLFWGESFTTDQEYGESICEEIIRKDLHITWSTTTRVDTINEVLLNKMKKAGCTLLGLGIESYDQEVLNNARKRIKIEQIDNAVSMVKKSGISSMGHFVFGLPGDTPEKAKKTIRFALKNVDFAQFYCAIPYPKTELGNIAIEKNWIHNRDFENLDLTRSVMGNETMSPREIKKLRDFAFARFYFRPGMFIQALKEIKSFKALFSLLNFLKWIRS